MRPSVELAVGFTKDIEIKLEPLVGLMLREVTRGECSMFDAEGKPLKPEDPRPARILTSAGEPETENE